MLSKIQSLIECVLGTQIEMTELTELTEIHDLDLTETQVYRLEELLTNELQAPIHLPDCLKVGDILEQYYEYNQEEWRVSEGDEEEPVDECGVSFDEDLDAGMDEEPDDL